MLKVHEKLKKKYTKMKIFKNTSDQNETYKI